MIPTVACVEWGNYCGRGAEYVERLRSMVARHLNTAHRFECIRPDRELVGWWNKIELFRPGRFGGRVLFFDLDTVIVSSIDALIEQKGIIHLEHWGWTRNDYNSSVMLWDGDEHRAIFEQFTPDVPQQYRGDQDWMTALGGWDALRPGQCVSYKYHCKNGPPAGASVVCFHGAKKPHDFSDGWVADHWR